MWNWLRLFVLAAVVLPVAAAIGDTAPQLVLATPGTGGGAIERFTLRFSEAMVPLGDPRAAPPGTMTCPVASTGRWIDQQTFVFEFARALPGGLTCKIAIKKGLASARGAALPGIADLTIDTGGPSARTVLPDGGEEGIEEGQVFLIATNVAPDRASVAAHGYCAVDGIGEKIVLDVLPAELPAQILTAIGDREWRVRYFLENAGLAQKLPGNPADLKRALATVTAVKCRRPLPPGREVAVVWDAAIASPDGRTAARDQRFDFTVRKAFEARFECSRVNPQAGCNPINDAHVRFSAPIPMEVAKAIRLTFADGTTQTPVFDDDEKNDTTVADLDFKGPFPASTSATISLPADVKDQSGRTLANGARFPLGVKFDAAPPLVKFAAPFGILEAREGGVLPVTVRAVEPQLAQRVVAVNGTSLRVAGTDGEIAAWLRKLEVANDVDFREEPTGVKDETRTVNYTGAQSLLGTQGTALKLGLPGAGKAFEVIGVPLTKPGFYVVELASPTLGAALLGRDATRYVSAGALVTNMAVHFKWGHESSLVWVTALDTGKPVAGADLVITDSCTGRQLAHGKSDSQGRAMVPQGLPEPDTYASCNDGSSTHALMISARNGDDFSFTLTEWGEGIRPYDFDLPFGDSSDNGEILHTVFDRTLIRAGETVNMKHILRAPVGSGFAFTDAIDGILRISHRGSDTQFDMPLRIGRDGIGENSWTAPQGAPMGDYDVSVIVGVRTLPSSQTIRVDEFRLPTMRATVTGPKTALVRPANVALDLFVGYLSGGGASNLPVAIRTAFSTDDSAPEGWDGWSFGGDAPKEGTTSLDDDGDAAAAPVPQSQTLPVTLNASGTAQTSIDINQPIERTTAMTVEMDYQDANGETLTASRSILLNPAAVRIGIKTDGWLMRDSDLRLKFAAIGVDGKPQRGQRVNVSLYSRETITARRRLIGGFYAYDNQARVTKIGNGCSASTDEKGLAECQIDAGVSGEVIVVATTTDADGNVSRAVKTVWLAGADEWWFGGDNGDRMDLIAEAPSYQAGETAKFQVRMPFREATALVTVEREGVLSSFVTTLSGKDPVISVPMPAAYAPDVYVSVMAVRGRVSGWSLWWAKTLRSWGWQSEAAAPTALVDLAKPSYRIGIAKVQVGWEGHELGVTVKADKAKYAVRDTAQIDVAVTEPGGAPARSAEIAFVAVDEALLQLQPNDSWGLLDAMMGERTLDVITSTGQTQVVGKRHYGKKAVEAGGGGGGDETGVTRDDFRPVLLWRGRVPLDARGRARIPVTLSDSLSAFKLVAIANSGAQLFGTGQISVRTAQDLSVYSALPPLVRSGDFYGASFTLRNGSDKPMDVTATVKVNPSVAVGRPLTVSIPAGGAVPVTWNLPAPDGVTKLDWVVEARSADGKAIDRLAVSQDVAPAFPIEVWAATLTRVGSANGFPIMAPAGALPGSYVDIKLSDTLAPPLEGVRAYMTAYPYNCFEQQLSRAVALGDVGRWGALAGAIPTYLDADGLLKYFPSDQMEGSEALTAYALSVTAEAGFAVPEVAKGRMVEALKAVIEGRLKRDYQGPSDIRLLKVAALAALARNGASSAGLVSNIDIAPADMPTATLADWMTVIDRTPGLGNATGLRVIAERTLRQRIVYEGSRVDLTDRDNAPWWMMVSRDEGVIRALNAVLGRPGWTDEGPKLMVGVALRQARGHWDTTPANAWGAIAARRFASLYPASAVAGTTTATLGPVSRAQSWPMASGAGPLRLPVPAAPAPLMVNQSGGAGPWAIVSVHAAVPLRQPLFAGYRAEKAISIISQKNKGYLTRGDVIRIRITVDATAERNWVVVSDPVPPGATIIGGLGGQSAILGAQADADNGEAGVRPAYVERGRDAYRAYFYWVPRGRFVTEYAVRLNGTGRFNLPPTRVEAMYSPEIRAQVPNRGIAVRMQ